MVVGILKELNNSNKMTEINETLPKQCNRVELLKKLRCKLTERSIIRKKKRVKKQVLETELKKIGIDTSRLEHDIDRVREQGGISMDISN